MFRLVVGVSIAALATPVAAGAQSGSGELVQALTRCRTIPAADARLACFDTAAAALDAAVKSKDVAIVDRQEVRKAKRSLFGFTIGRIPLFDDDDAPDDKQREEFTELNTTVVSARATGNGRVELRVAEGDAVWMTTDPLAFPPRSGTKIRIRRGALGNYFLVIDGGRAVRGMRLR